MFRTYASNEKNKNKTSAKESSTTFGMPFVVAQTLRLLGLWTWHPTEYWKLPFKWTEKLQWKHKFTFFRCKFFRLSFPWIGIIVANERHVNFSNETEDDQSVCMCVCVCIEAASEGCNQLLLNVCFIFAVASRTVGADLKEIFLY